MIAPWVEEEMVTADLNDKRLTERLNVVLTALAERPRASIPAACGGYAETTAAYRFFDNEKVTFEQVLAPHIASTIRRAAEQPVVLMVQDTSEVDLSRPRQQVQGAGPLEGGPRRGAFLHEMQVFTPDGTPLGTIWAEAWAREDDDGKKDAAQKRQERKAASIEEKESYRWLEGLRHARTVAEQLPGVQCICVADSEADIYELFAEPTGESPGLDWIVRGCQDRALVQSETTARCVREEVLKQPVLFTHTVTVREREAKFSCEKRGRRQSRQPREAVVEVRAGRVRLRPPSRPDRKLPKVSVNVVLVREADPPAGEEPIEWILFTTLPVDTVEQVRQIIQYYCTRWMVEVFFRTLKSGCRVEERRFEHLDRLLPCLATYLIVAWRTLYLCRLGRSCPDLDCEAVFEPCEWKSVLHDHPPPATTAAATASGRNDSFDCPVGRIREPEATGPSRTPNGLARPATNV